MATTTHPGGRVQQDSTVLSTAPTAGVVWAIIGVFSLLYVAYLMVAWITSPDFARTMPAAPVPDIIQTKLLILQVFTCAVTVLVVYFFVIKPKLQTGRFTFIALF